MTLLSEISIKALYKYIEYLDYLQLPIDLIDKIELDILLSYFTGIIYYTSKVEDLLQQHEALRYSCDVNDFDYTEFKNPYTQKIFENILNNLKHIKCYVFTKPIPKSVVRVELYDEDKNKELVLPINVKHITIQTLESVKFIHPNILSLMLIQTDQYQVDIEQIAHFKFLVRLECNIVDISRLNELENLRSFYLDLNAVFTEGKTSINFEHMTKLEHIILYTTRYTTEKTEFSILGLNSLKLKSLAIRNLYFSCNKLYIPVIITVTYFYLYYDRKYISIDGLEFTDKLKHLYIQGDSLTIFDILVKKI